MSTTKVKITGNYMQSLKDIDKAQNRAERCMSLICLDPYEHTLVGQSISDLKSIINDCVSSIERLTKFIVEFESADAYDEVRLRSIKEGMTQEEKAEVEEKMFHQHMQLVHAVEHCILELDVCRARGDIFFMDAIQEVQHGDIRGEDTALLTDIFLALKDVYDDSLEVMEKTRFLISENI